MRDLVIGTAFWATAFLAFTFPCWGPLAAFIAGALLGLG